MNLRPADALTASELSFIDSMPTEELVETIAETMKVEAFDDAHAARLRASIAYAAQVLAARFS